MYFTQNFMILFLFCRSCRDEYDKNKNKIKKKLFLARKSYPNFSYMLVLCLRINDVGKICSSRMLCRWTWRTTFIPGLILDSHSYELQNFLKFNDQLLQSAVWQKISKNHISLCIRLNFIIIFLFCRS